MVFIGFVVLIIAFLWTYPPNTLARIQETYSPEMLKHLYDLSQYTIPNSQNPISDAQLYVYAGYEYITGDNPMRINAEHITVGKYLIGLIYTLTGYVKISGLLFAILLCGLSLWLLQIKTRSPMALFVFLFLFVTDTNIRYQITDGPLLDIIQIFFWMMYVALLLKAIPAQKLSLTIYAGVVLGFMASSKMYFPAILTFMVSALLLWTKVKTWSITIRTLGAIALTCTLTYTATYIVYFFAYDGTLVSFIKSQLWIFHFWADNPVNTMAKFGGLIPLILINHYHVWWGDSPVIAYEDWTIMWPIGLILMVISLIAYVRTRSKAQWNAIREMTDMLALWLVIVFMYLLTVPISPRYLLLLYVPGYVFIGLVIFGISKKHYANTQ